MNINEKGLSIIKEFEAPNGPDLTAYLDPVGVWTIGYGNTVYKNGKKVKKGDKITTCEAEDLFKYWIGVFEKDVEKLVTSKVNENQFSALVCFAYNVGTDIDSDSIAEGLGDSTLLKLVNKNPNDPNIAKEFLKWNKGTVKGVKQELPGLTRRRKMEAALYNTK
jgi:lysozyme